MYDYILILLAEDYRHRKSTTHQPEVLGWWKAIVAAIKATFR